LAYQFELGLYTDPTATFLQPQSYWNAQQMGLTAGEGLMLDLHRMDAAYLAQNKREVELTKHVSMALTQPIALVQLRETAPVKWCGTKPCSTPTTPVTSSSPPPPSLLTVPCVTGPYTGVNAELPTPRCSDPHFRHRGPH